MILSENFCTGPRRAADAARTAAPGPLAAVASDPPRAGCRAMPGRRTELAADGEQDRWRACRQTWPVSCRGETPRRPLVLDTSPRPHFRTYLRSRASTAASPVRRPLGVRPYGVPGPAGPVDIPEGPRTCVMQSAAEVDEPIRAADQRGEHVGRQGVHRERRRVTFGGRGAGRLEEDAGIVDNSVHPCPAGAELGHRQGLPGPGLPSTRSPSQPTRCDPRASFSDALHTMEIIQAVVRSSGSGGSAVPVS